MVGAPSGGEREEAGATSESPPAPLGGGAAAATAPLDGASAKEKR
jgi:hypothetical protein